jgi:MFS family permease
MAMRTALAPLRHADFRRLWTAQSISTVGDKVNQVGLIIMVFRLTGSYAQMGLVFGITFLPAALFGMLAGPFVDRWDRRRTMIVSDVLRAVLVALIPLAVGFGLPAVYALAFLVATVSLFFQPARMALVPQVVDESELMAANSLDWTTESVAELLGIGFGGALVFIVGINSAFFIDSATYLLSAIFIAVVSHRALRSLAPRLNPAAIWAEARDGLQRIRRDPVLTPVIVSFGLAALGGAAAITLSVLLALNVYAGSGLPDALRVTVVDLSTAIGLLAGSLMVGSSGSGRAGRKYLGGLVAFGAVFALLGLVHDIRVAAVMMVAVGIANMFMMVPMITILQTHTEDATRGRVFAARTTITRIATVIGFAGAGAAAQAFGVLPLVGIVGVFVCAVGLVGFALPRLRDA